MKRSSNNRNNKAKNHKGVEAARPNQHKATSERTDLAKNAFIANISHEIRTPMNAIMGFAQMLRGSGLNEQQADYVNVIIDSGKKLLLIIGNLLDLSNLQLGKTTLNPVPCHPEAMADRLWQHSRIPIANKNLNPILECAKDMPELILDCEKVERVVCYIISNAVKYTQTGFVKFSIYTKPLSEREVLLCLEISDSGIGISEDKLPFIFEVFEQADNSITRAYNGMGIGLGLSRQLVALLGGTITAKSTLGEGSRFIIEIPALKA